MQGPRPEADHGTGLGDEGTGGVGEEGTVVV